MAEENVILPKERYQRLLDQIEKYKSTQNKEIHKETKDVSTTNASEPEETSLENTVNTSEREHSPVSRTRDDVVSMESPTPPGITPAELRALMVSEQKNKRKKKKKTTLSPRKAQSARIMLSTTKKPRNKTTLKNLKLVKQNWLTV